VLVESIPGLVLGAKGHDGQQQAEAKDHVDDGKETRHWAHKEPSSAQQGGMRKRGWIATHSIGLASLLPRSSHRATVSWPARVPSLRLPGNRTIDHGGSNHPRPILVDKEVRGKTNAHGSATAGETKVKNTTLLSCDDEEEFCDMKEP